MPRPTYAFSRAASFGAALLLLACSSVQKLPLEERVIPLPNLNYSDPSAKQAGGADDYKRRTRGIPGVRLALLSVSPRGDSKLDPVLRRMVLDGALATLRFGDVRLHELEPEILAGFPDARSLAALRAIEVDAVVSVAIELFDEGRGGAEIDLRDPVTGESFGKRRMLFTVETARTPASSQLDYYVDGRRMRFVADSSGPAVRFEVPGKGAMRALIERSVTGTLSVMATAPGAVVYVRHAGVRRKLGKAPLLNVPLREGTSIVEVRRRGYDAYRTQVLIRAGRESRVQAIWPGDTKLTSLALYSVPPDLRVALDGVVRGVTPLFLSGIRASNYSIELSRPGKETADYTVASTAGLRVGEGENESRAFFVKYSTNFESGLLDAGLMQLASEDGSVRFHPNKGLGIKGQGAASAWRGVATLPFSPKTTQATVDLVQAAGRESAIAIIGSTESLLLQQKAGKFTLTRYRGRDAVGQPADFRALREGNVHEVSVETLTAEGELVLRLDGSTLFRGKWSPGDAVRLAVLTRGSSADGQPIATGLRIRSGIGRFEE